MLGQSSANGDVVAARHGTACQKFMSGRRVVDVRMMDRPNDRQMATASGEMGKVFGDHQSRNVGGDRLKLAPHLFGRIGLQVPCLLLRRPAPHKEKDTSFGLAK